MINGEFIGHTSGLMVSSGVKCPHLHIFLHKLREVITRSGVAMGILVIPEIADSTSDEKRSIKMNFASY